MVAYLSRQGPHPPTGSALGPGSFRRIVDVPFETCVAALDSWQQREEGGELRLAQACCAGRSTTFPARLRAGSRSAWPGARCARACA
jgi:hypothetical protein